MSLRHVVIRSSYFQLTDVWQACIRLLCAHVAHVWSSWLPVSTFYTLIVIWLFKVFAASYLESVLFLSPDQQSGIHCQIWTAEHLWHVLKTHLCTGHYRALSHGSVLCNCSLQVNIYLLTHCTLVKVKLQYTVLCVIGPVCLCVCDCATVRSSTPLIIAKQG